MEIGWKIISWRLLRFIEETNIKERYLKSSCHPREVKTVVITREIHSTDIQGFFYPLGSGKNSAECNCFILTKFISLVSSKIKKLGVWYEHP